MRYPYEENFDNARKIQGRILSGEDKIVPPQNWVWFARYLWPAKTAACLASLAGKDERTAKRWLAGEFEPPTSWSRLSSPTVRTTWMTAAG